MTLSTRSLKLNQLFNPGKDINYLRVRMTLLGYSFEDYRPEFTPDGLASYYADINNGFWQDWCSLIHIPSDADCNMKRELMDAVNNPKYAWAFDPNSRQEANYDDGFLLKRY